MKTANCPCVCSDNRGGRQNLTGDTRGVPGRRRHVRRHCQEPWRRVAHLLPAEHRGSGSQRRNAADWSRTAVQTYLHPAATEQGSAGGQQGAPHVCRQWPA